MRLAQKFESLALSDERFEIPAKRHLGMVVFRLAGENDLTEKLLKKLNGSGTYEKSEIIFLGAQAKRGASNSLILQEDQEGREEESDH